MAVFSNWISLKCCSIPYSWFKTLLRDAITSSVGCFKSWMIMYVKILLEAIWDLRSFVVCLSFWFSCWSCSKILCSFWDKKWLSAINYKSSSGLSPALWLSISKFRMPESIRETPFDKLAFYSNGLDPTSASLLSWAFCKLKTWLLNIFKYPAHFRASRFSKIDICSLT